MPNIQSRLSFTIQATGTDLHLTVGIDAAKIYDDLVSEEASTVYFDFDDAQEGDHTLYFELKGKLPEHTVMDDEGTILQDRVLIITDIRFDDIPLGNLVPQIARYHHDTNGTTDAVVDQFYDVMGCNGRVELRFSTPIYLWLLENI